VGPDIDADGRPVRHAFTAPDGSAWTVYRESGVWGGSHTPGTPIPTLPAGYVFTSEDGQRYRFTPEGAVGRFMSADAFARATPAQLAELYAASRTLDGPPPPL
jgi:hypothetical protein